MGAISKSETIFSQNQKGSSLGKTKTTKSIDVINMGSVSSLSSCYNQKTEYQLIIPYATT